MEILGIEFLNPGYFWLLLLLPLVLYFFIKTLESGVSFNFISDIKNSFGGNSIAFFIKPFLLFFIYIFFVIILANPNTTNVSETVEKNGIDIVIALDISGSMEAEDLKPNRMESAKEVINGFISTLSTDRLGLVVFAGKPFTSIPLTFDYSILIETISRLGTNNIDQSRRSLSGTAIGDAILMAKTLFKAPENETQEEYSNREKVIILLTDGEANSGVEPVLAGLAAKKEGIKIYTIGIGNEKGGFITYNSGPFEQRIPIPPLNDKDLKQIAKDTNGQYFRADNNDTFQSIFDELSKLDKHDIKVDIKKEYSEYYKPFMNVLILLLGFFTFLMIYKPEFRNNN